MRKFRVDASRKIQASPVDFESLDAEFPAINNADLIKNELESYINAKELR